MIRAWDANKNCPGMINFSRRRLRWSDNIGRNDAAEDGQGNREREEKAVVRL